MNNKPICPECKKEMDVMYASPNEKNDYFDCLCHCESCLNGLSVDWKSVYSPTSGYTNFERHFWG